MPVTLTDEARDELLVALKRMKAELAAIHPERAAEPFDDEERETLRSHLVADSDTDLISILLTLHKTIESQATGKARELLERQAVVLTTVLDRFAPVPFRDALAVWEEHTEDDDA